MAKDTKKDLGLRTGQELRTFSMSVSEWAGSARSTAAVEAAENSKAVVLDPVGDAVKVAAACFGMALFPKKGNVMSITPGQEPSVFMEPSTDEVCTWTKALFRLCTTWLGQPEDVRHTSVDVSEIFSKHMSWHINRSSPILDMIVAWSKEAGDKDGDGK